MRLATFSVPKDDDTARAGVLCRDRMLDLARCAEALEPAQPFFPSMRALLEAGDEGMARTRRLLETAAADADLLARVSFDAEAVSLLPPIPDADKFLCVGKNYRTHLEELKRNDLVKEMPGEVTGFVKLNSSLVGHNAKVVKPDNIARLDYEPELVFVIGRRALGVTQD